MRKIILAAVVILFSSPITPAYAAPSTGNVCECDAVIARLLSPHIQAEIEKYYEKILVSPPTYAPWYETSITCKSASSNKTTYGVTVTISPYIGPHISVGVDEIGFLISANGEVKPQYFKHLEDHKLPPHYQDMYR